MNTPTMGLRIASIMFGLAGFAQLLRLLTETEIMIAGHRVPVWFSGIAVLVAGSLCVWLWRLSAAPGSGDKPADNGTPSHPTPA